MTNQFWFHLSDTSTNGKTGAMPVSTTSQNSCPSHCPFWKNGGYCWNFPLVIHWNKVSSGERGITLEQFTARIAAMPEGTIWRHNQAGDLPGDKATNTLDGEQVNAIVQANRGRRGATYCHYPPEIADNARIIANANTNGFVVNLSADNIAEADRFVKLGIAPVTVVVAHDQKENFRTPDNNLVVVCPAQTHEDIDCKKCKLCWWAGRKVIVGFQAHGSSKKKAELVAIQAAN